MPEAFTHGLSTAEAQAKSNESRTHGSRSGSEAPRPLIDSSVYYNFTPPVWGSLAQSSSSQSAADSVVPPAARGLLGQRPLSPKKLVRWAQWKGFRSSAPFASEDLIPSSLAHSITLVYRNLYRTLVYCEEDRQTGVLP